jgi:hypothetical protein
VSRKVRDFLRYLTTAIPTSELTGSTTLWIGGRSLAAQIYAEAVSGIPDRMCRDRGVYVARMALAHAAAGELDAAAAAGLDALSVARVTRSGRIVLELRRLDSAVARHRTRDTVMLREALAGVIGPSRHS